MSFATRSCPTDRVHLSWEHDNPDTLRLIFLIADAPPHLDYQQDYDYSYTLLVLQRRLT